MDEEMDQEETVGDSRGISRRNLIKGGAILGGTIWVAPVIDSITNKVAAQSNANYCCSCWPPPSAKGGYQGESDEHPPTAQLCAEYCAASGYTNYTWCGPSAVPLTYVSDASSPGCYTGTATSLTAATNCMTGTVNPFSESGPVLGTHV